MNKLSVPYLNLGIIHPYFSQEKLIFEFHFGINEEGYSLQSNSEWLMNATYKLIGELYKEKFYSCRHGDIMKILGIIAFQREYFSEKLICYTKK